MRRITRHVDSIEVLLRTCLEGVVRRLRHGRICVGRFCRLRSVSSRTMNKRKGRAGNRKTAHIRSQSRFSRKEPKRKWRARNTFKQGGVHISVYCYVTTLHFLLTSLDSSVIGNQWVQAAKQWHAGIDYTWHYDIPRLYIYIYIA